MTGFGRGPRLAATDKGLCLVAIDGETGTVRAWSSRRSPHVERAVRRHARAEGRGRRVARAGRRRAAARVRVLDRPAHEAARAVGRALDWTAASTWGAESCVYRSPSGSICPCCAPSATYLRDSTLVVMFRNEIEGARDPWLVHVAATAARRSRRRASSATGTWKIDACPSDGGAIVAADPGWLAIWRRDAERLPLDAGRCPSTGARRVSCRRCAQRPGHEHGLAGHAQRQADPRAARHRAARRRAGRDDLDVVRFARARSARRLRVRGLRCATRGLEAYVQISPSPSFSRTL